jgi:16S rRNA (cytosine967-C5)-methyltransferase
MRTRFEHFAQAANIKIEQADATVPSSALDNFDLILCDVPCTGTGTLARNPEIRHRLTPAEVSRQASRQQKILTAALSRLAPGGRLLYSTCSLEPEECEQIVQAVTPRLDLKDIRNLPLDSVLGQLGSSGLLQQELPSAIRGNFLRTLPGTHPGDGFFAALFERSGQS